MTVRKPETEQAYQNAKATGDLEPLHLVKPIKEWDHWKLVANRFPHDRLNAKHLMVVLKREANIFAITNAELDELWRTVLPELDDQYHYVKLNLAAMRSVANVPHLHVCDFTEDYL